MLALTPSTKKILVIVLATGMTCGYLMATWFFVITQDKTANMSDPVVPTVSQEEVVEQTEPKPVTEQRKNETAYKPVHHTGLITNEFAFYNSERSDAVKSDDWDVSSGSLFAKDRAFWTGVPDSCGTGPNAKSTNCTHSDVFRATTKKKFAGNTQVSLAIKQLEDIHDTNCSDDDTCWHGTHVWLRYQNQYNLYYASLNRADGEIVIKRKVPCGNDNDGTYFTLGTAVAHDFKTNEWNTYTASVRTEADKTVIITISDGTGKPIMSAQDKGGTNPRWSSACDVPGKYASPHFEPITTPGGIGIRGDFSNFMFKDLVVREQ